MERELYHSEEGLSVNRSERKQMQDMCKQIVPLVVKTDFEQVW